MRRQVLTDLLSALSQLYVFTVFGAYLRSTQLLEINSTLIK